MFNADLYSQLSVILNRTSLQGRVVAGVVIAANIVVFNASFMTITYAIQESLRQFWVTQLLLNTTASLYRPYTFYSSDRT